MNLVALKDQLKIDEGLRLFPYGDLKGRLTIGYGHNLSDKGISLEIANVLLEQDIDQAVAQLRQKWPPFDHLDDVRQQVMANLAFNLGVEGLLQFTHTLAAAARGDYAAAAAGMRGSVWAGQVGARAVRLEKMMETGELPL